MTLGELLDGPRGTSGHRLEGLSTLEDVERLLDQHRWLRKRGKIGSMQSLIWVARVTPTKWERIARMDPHTGEWNWASSLQFPPEEPLFNRPSDDEADSDTPLPI
jgi:hypothetical protein